MEVNHMTIVPFHGKVEGDLS